MSYRYCRECAEGMPEPTPYEDLIAREQRCVNGHYNPPDKVTAEWVVKIWETLKTPEENK